jgi:adenosylhomocysteine nucleosidase
MLAPMQPELQPLVRRLAMEGDGTLYRGRAGDVEVVALLTTIGMAAGARAAQRILELEVDRVIVVGIAGGVDHRVEIGDVIVPEVVIDRATGGAYSPSAIGDIAPRGTLSCGDELIIDAAVLAEMAEQGVVAVDMETAAVAAVCERAECPWSVFRGISDYAGDGLVDDALFALTLPDGTADPDALARYLKANPERAPVLARLAHDMNLATEAAAAAAIRSFAAL